VLIIAICSALTGFSLGISFGSRNAWYLLGVIAWLIVTLAAFYWFRRVRDGHLARPS
jgi:hypothetical protein